MNDHIMYVMFPCWLLVVRLLIVGHFGSKVVHSQDIPNRIQVVVSLGDSYASGNGARDCGRASYDDDVQGCFRSRTSWGAQFAQRLGAMYISRGCSGNGVASIDTPFYLSTELKPFGTCPSLAFPLEEFYTEEKVLRCDRYVMAPTSSLSVWNPDLVLVATGANDFQFGGIVFNCLFPGVQNPSGCQQQIDFGRNTRELDARIDRGVIDD